MRWPLVLAILAALPLAGCASNSGTPDSAQFLIAGVDSTGLVSDTYYAFEHRGGGLEFALSGNASAVLEVFDANDQRLGRVDFGSDGEQSARYELRDVAAGSPVLQVISLTGTLRIESAGNEVSDFRPLLKSVERTVLVSRGPSPEPVYVPGTGGNPVNAIVPVALRRAPSEFRLFASGDFTDLEVSIVSVRGPVLKSNTVDSPFFAGSSFAARGFSEISSQRFPENFGDGQYQAHVQAADLSGALIVEATSYSRAELQPAAGAALLLKRPEFTYGALPAEPVAFQVHADAQWLYLWQAQGDETKPGPDPGIPPAWVALYDATDSKLGTVQVPANDTIRIPVQSGGDYVAVLLSGAAMLGADVIPADFQLHPLSKSETTAPTKAAGTNGRYGISHENVTPAGIPYLLAITTRGSNNGPFPSINGACRNGGHASLDFAGEPILIAGDSPTVALQGALRLGTTNLTVTWDGFGSDACTHPAIKITGYIRQPLT